MIAYLDASALVKRYVAEAGSAEVGGLVGQAEAVGTAVVSRAEVAGAVSRQFLLTTAVSFALFRSLRKSQRGAS
jgi:predicted nucleic acid-binding protein